MGNLLCCMERKHKETSPIFNANKLLPEYNPNILFNPNETISAISPIVSSPSQNDLSNSLINSNSRIEINFEKEIENNEDEIHFDENNHSINSTNQQFDEQVTLQNENNKERLNSYPLKFDIEINSFSISYKSLFYFGMYFNPHICIYVNNTLLGEISPLNNNNNDKSLSYISTLNSSRMSCISQNSKLSDVESGNNDNNLKANKIYLYTFKKTFNNFNNSDEHSLINIVIINEINNVLQNKAINVNKNKIHNVVIGRLCIDPMDNFNHNEQYIQNKIFLYLNEEQIGEVEMTINYRNKFNNDNNNNLCHLNSLTLSEISSLTPSLNSELIMNKNLNDINSIEHNLFSFINEYKPASSNDIILLYLIISILTPYDINSFQFTSSVFNNIYNNKHSLSQLSQFLSTVTYNLCLLHKLSIFIYQYCYFFMKGNKENTISSISNIVKEIIDFLFDVAFMLYNYFYNNEKIILCNKERVIFMNSISVINNILTYSKPNTPQYANKILLSNEINNKIIKVYELFVTDSEIMMMNTKLIRKSLLTIIAYNKNKQFSLSNDTLSILPNTILKVAHIYQHYPQLYINILAIVFNLTYKDKNNIIKINIESFTSNFILYKGILKGELKQINKFHLGILFNVLTNNKELIDNKNIDFIITDLNKYYSKNKISLDFIKRKQKNIDIHEKLLAIIVEIFTKNIEIKKICKEIYEDMINFILFLKTEYINTLKGKEFIVCCIILHTVKLLDTICDNDDEKVLKDVIDIVDKKCKMDIDDFCKEIIVVELIGNIKKHTNTKYEKEINQITEIIEKIKEYFTEGQNENSGE